MLFEHSKMQKLSTCWAKEAWRDSWKHWQSFGYVVAAQIGCDVLVLAIAHIVNKNFQNIISPQVLMLFEQFKMQKLSSSWAKEA